jgi:hypothetical protein
MRTGWVAAALGVLILVSAGPAGAQPATSARAHYEGGTKLGRLQRYGDALREFRAAYEIDPRPICLYNIAWALEHLGKAPDALDAYRAYLDSADPADATVADARRAVGELAPGVERQGLGILRIGAVGAASRVRIDGGFARAPGRPVVVHVASGEHAVVREVEGWAVRHVKVIVAAGEDRLVAVDGVDVPEPAPEPVPAAPAAPPAPTAGALPLPVRENPGRFAVGTTFIVVGSVLGAVSTVMLGYSLSSSCKTCDSFGGASILSLAGVAGGIALVSTGVPLFMAGNRMVVPGKRVAAGPEIVLMPGGAGLKGRF